MVIEWPQLFLASYLSFLLICLFFLFRNKNGLPTNWPILGMSVVLLKHMHRIHDFCCEILEKSPVTFVFEGPWFANMHILLTADPLNVRYIMSTNFTNYPKGPKFKEIFDVLGDGHVNADSNLWMYHRKMAESFLHNPRFPNYSLNKVREKVEKGIIPILKHSSKQGLIIDLQDLFERYTFDAICTVIMGHSFESLSVDLPPIPFNKAFNEVEEAIVYRHIIPVSVWKFMHRLGIGKEKKHVEGCKVIDEFLCICIAKKREEMQSKSSTKHEEADEAHNKDHLEVDDDLLTMYIMKPNNKIRLQIDSGDDKFLKDTMLNYILAGRDTTSSALSWFFYLLSKNPQVELKIRNELKLVMSTSNISDNFEKVSDKLVYLHGALCETLRLYPPVVFESKTPDKPDILPSGHKVNSSTTILFNLYAMARMKSIWGENCNEFEPERWITKEGTVKHEPSYKFLAFNTGPRTCLGKDMALKQMKLTTAIIIQNYRIEVLEDHLVTPEISFILRMKHGLKVKVFPRNI